MNFPKIFAAILPTLLLCACGSSLSVPEASVKSQLDTLSWCIGVYESMPAEEFLNHLEAIDIKESRKNDFLNGLYAGLAAQPEPEGADETFEAAIQGYQTGERIRKTRLMSVCHMIGIDAGKTPLNPAIVARGYIAFATADSIPAGLPRTRAEAEQTADRLIQTLSESHAAENYGKGKGVRLLQDGIYYRVLQEGTGAKPTRESQVEVVYEGKLEDGTVFDATSRHGKPSDTFGVGQVIPGWQKALTAMSVGSKWEVYIPSDQAYGAQGTGGIPPYSPLIFTIELISIK